jgi:hypothetical protein
MVVMLGAPTEPWKMSRSERNETEAPPGMSVKDANKAWTIVKSIVGKASRTISKETVSEAGRDLRMVEAI